MTTKKRLVHLAVAAVLLVGLLFLLAALLAPRILDSQMVRDTIRQEVSSRTGGTLTLENIRLEIFPMPRLKVSGPRFVHGETISVLADTVVLYPRILPLLTGDLEIARLRIKAPSAVYAPAAPADAEKGTGRAPAVEALLPMLQSAIDRVRQQVPDLSVEVAGGSLTLTPESGPQLFLEQIDARLSTAKPRLDLSCRSNLWESLRLRWNFDEKGPPGTAQITVFQLQPAPVVNLLLHREGLGLQSARLNLTLTLAADANRMPYLTFSGALPESVFEKKEAQVPVSADSFSGAVRFENGRLRLDVDRWRGKEPALELAAGFDFAMDKDGAFSLENVEVRGRDIDVAAVKAPVLLFSGSGEDLMQDVFEVLEGGLVKSLQLKVRIPGPLGSLQAGDFFLEGRIADGAIHIPEIDLDLTAVSGRAEIRNGLLAVSNASALHKAAVGTGGAFFLSLFDGSDRIDLDVQVDAELSALQHTLARIIKDPSVTDKLDRVRSIEGTATGRLRLGETLEDLRVRVDVDQISAAAAVSFLPKPVELSGRGISWGETSISVDALDLKTGGADFAGISGRLDWEKEATFDAVADSVEIRIDPVMTWLPNTAGFAELLSDLAFSGGELRLDKLTLSGPLETPGRWQYDAAGRLKAVTIATDRLPAPLDVGRLTFQATPGHFWIEDFKLGCLDAELSGRGSVTGGPPQLEEARFSVSGKIGPEADRWLLSRFGAPEYLALRVHRISGGEIRWKRGGFFDLSGDLALDSDMEASVSVSIGPDRFDLKRISIEDGDSKAEASFQRSASVAAFSYNGRLHRETVDRLVKDNRLVKGRIMGGLRGRIDLEAPGQSEIEGRLEVEDLILPLPGGPDTRIDRASLFGEGRRLDVERLDVAVDGMIHRLSGVIERKTDAFRIDMNLSAERVDYNRIRQAFGDLAREKDASSGQSRFPVLGTVAFDVGTLLYERYRFDDLSGRIDVRTDRTELTLERGLLCGISVPATIVFRPEVLSFQVRPAATGGQLAESSVCLLDNSGPVEGRFSLHGSLSGEGRPEEIVSSLNGKLAFSAQDGVVRQNTGFRLLHRVLALINVTEVFAGSMPDFSRSGVRYNAVRARADVEAGVMRIREFVFDGKNVTLTAQGSVNLVDKGLDLTVLVAPLKTVDRIVGKIPLVSDIFEGTLVSIPVKIRGTLDAPKTNFIAPSAVGKGLIGITERTLKLPFKLIRPDQPLEAP